MLREITLGQYYDTKSVIHELDPRTKLIGTFVFRSEEHTSELQSR